MPLSSFQHEHDTKRYLKELKERLVEYKLELNEDKTKLIRFGRFAQINRPSVEKGNFLGFVHILAKAQGGWFDVRRITDGKRRREKLRAIKQELRPRMHEPIAKVGA